MSPSPGIIVRRPVDYAPPERLAVASALRDVAARVQGLADDLRGQKGILGTEWLGNAQQRFFIRDGFEHAPSCLETLVASLEEHAKRIEQIEVVIWVSEIVYATDPAYRPWE